jgi:hypothetical protein
MIHLVIAAGLSFTYFTGASYTFTRLHRRWMVRCAHDDPTVSPTNAMEHIHGQCWHIEQAVLVGLMWPFVRMVGDIRRPPIVAGEPLGQAVKALQRAAPGIESR